MNQKQILNSILVLSSIIVICNNVLFNDYPEIIPKGHEIGNILSNLSLAYISSYIFYIVVVLYQENKDKKNIYSSVYVLTRQLVGRGNSVVTILASANNFTKENLTRNITKNEFITLCQNTNPATVSPTWALGSLDNLIPATYGQLIHNNSYNNVNALIGQIFIYMPFLESDFVKLLNELKNSTFFIMADVLVNPAFNNNNFEAMVDPMYEYHLILRKIDNYIEKHYAKYIN